MLVKMKSFKIAKKTNEFVLPTTLNFISGGTSGNDIYVVIKKEQAYGLNIGSKLIMVKNASGNTGQMIKVCEESITVKSIAFNGEHAYVCFDYIYVRPLILETIADIIMSETEGYKYKLTFNSSHSMLPCDLNENYKIYVKRGTNILEFSGIALCYPSEIIRGKDKILEGGNCCNEEIRLFNYETMDKNSILAKNKTIISGSDFKPERGDLVLFATNPFFYTNPEVIPETNEKRITFYGCDGETVSLVKYNDSFELGVMLEDDYDAKRIFQEYQVNEQFANKIKNSIVPDFIDLEKVKYSPAFSGNSICLATGLTFNLHFRTRIQGQTEHTFEDTWHFDDGSKTWNGNGLNDEKRREELYLDQDFVNSSNLMGFLGFTDDDVYNQKNRIKQSFIRLSFYDSENPLTQNLLYYSTIFFDSGDLYGKYVKRKSWLEEAGSKYNHDIHDIVWSPTSITDTCSAVTSQLIVNDEYDMTRSGEGFNLYLFRQDAPIENDPQDIYMKVEFNHAGFGRTVPLIRWPKEKDEYGVEKPNGKPVKLTIENYLSNLYIKVRVALTEKGYVYTFPDAISSEDTNNGGRKNGIVWENERLILNLFEPMLEMDKVEKQNNG